MEEKKIFKVTSNPILRTGRGTQQIMLDVIIGLIPALAVGVYMFGAKAAMLLAVSIVSCVFFEWAYRKLMKKNTTVGDLSAVVTAILLVCVLPFLPLDMIKIFLSALLAPPLRRRLSQLRRRESKG